MHAVEWRSHVYFFFREIAMEFNYLEKVGQVPGKSLSSLPTQTTQGHSGWGQGHGDGHWGWEVIDGLSLLTQRGHRL